MAVASIKDLTVQYGSLTALDGFSVEIPEGCVGLLGPNGAGKTTLIKTLLGFLDASRGSGTVLGFDIFRQGKEIRQRVGFMPEQDCHIPGMSAVQFVAFAGELAGMPPEMAVARAHEVLEYCGLGEARYRNVETYSTGMKQRIKLAQAIVHGPKLLLLDEPTNGLDPKGREEMLELVRSISHGKGINVLVSSHLLPDIERISDEVIVLVGEGCARAGRFRTCSRSKASQSTWNSSSPAGRSRARSWPREANCSPREGSLSRPASRNSRRGYSQAVRVRPVGGFADSRVPGRPKIARRCVLGGREWAGSPIADLSYRDYTGPLSSPVGRWWVIARVSFQQNLKKKSLWWLTVMSGGYYFVFQAVVFFMEQFALSSSRGEETLREFLSRIVWIDQFVHGISTGQLWFFMIVLLVGAGSISNDFRANALLVYLSKPCDKRDYLLGKWFGMF